MLLLFLSAVMSGLETDRYEYSKLACRSRDEGGEGPHNPYKLRWCLHFLFTPPHPSHLTLAANLCFATNDREDCLKKCQDSIGAGLVNYNKSFPTCFSLRKCATKTTNHLLLPSLLRPRLKWIDTEGSAAGTRLLQSVCCCAVLYILT
jgi:hypothetical protein